MLQMLLADEQALEWIVLALGLALGAIVLTRLDRLRKVADIQLLYAAYLLLLFSWFFTAGEDLHYFRSLRELFNLLEHLSACVSVIVLLVWSVRAIRQKEIPL